MLTKELGLPDDARFNQDCSLRKLIACLIFLTHVNSDKPARCALHTDSENLNLPVSFKDFVSTWTFVGARSQTAIKCHAGLMTSRQSI